MNLYISKAVFAYWEDSGLKGLLGDLWKSTDVPAGAGQSDGVSVSLPRYTYSVSEGITAENPPDSKVRGYTVTFNCYASDEMKAGADVALVASKMQNAHRLEPALESQEAAGIMHISHCDVIGDSVTQTPSLNWRGMLTVEIIAGVRI